jgi:hypothetical protein
MPSRGRWLLAAAWMSWAAGCERLPEPESVGARLYVDRCATCHRAYQPASLKFEMWKLVVNRMQGVISRNGLPPLTQDETAVLLAYLERNSDP